MKGIAAQEPKRAKEPKSQKANREKIVNCQIKPKQTNNSKKHKSQRTKEPKSKINPKMKMKIKFFGVVKIF